MIQDMLFTEVAVLLVAKVEEVVDNIELTVGEGDRENESDCYIWLLFSRHTKLQDTPILISRESRSWSNWSDML